MSEKGKARISFSNDRHAKALKGSAEYRETYENRRLIAEVAMAVKGMREGAGLTQQQLANAIGSSQPTIARLERGLDQRVPRWDLLRRIAWALNKQLKWVFAERSEGTPLVEVASSRRQRRAPMTKETVRGRDQ